MAEKKAEEGIVAIWRGEMRDALKQWMWRQPESKSRPSVVLVCGLCILGAGLYLLLSGVYAPAHPYPALLIATVGLMLALEGTAKSVPAGWSKAARLLQRGAFMAWLGTLFIAAAGVLVWVLT